MFFGLERAGAPRQGDLFAAAEGIEKPWKMKRGKLSPRATTNWNELLVIG